MAHLQICKRSSFKSLGKGLNILGAGVDNSMVENQSVLVNRKLLLFMNCLAMIANKTNSVGT